MKEVLIFGSGSIGNHLANASRKIGLSVSVTDISNQALLRMKNKIYPMRYSKWDKSIKLIEYKNVFKLKKKFDLIIIGTPPATHYSLLSQIFERIDFKKMIIEKPFSTHQIKMSKKKIKFFFDKKYLFIGYNHSVSDSFIHFRKLISAIKKKDIQKIDVCWKEGWKGILNAHFWNKDEFSSYLGDLSKGGGSTHEHSHGIHLITCLEKILNFKLPIKITKFINFKKKDKKLFYDNFVNLTWKIENFFLTYTSDLLSEPAQKSVKIYTKKNKFELIFNYNKKYDLIKITNLLSGTYKIKKFAKKRATDFINEIKYVLKVNNKESYKNSFIHLKYGLKVQNIINSTFRNAK